MTPSPAQPPQRWLGTLRMLAQASERRESAGADPARRQRQLRIAALGLALNCLPWCLYMVWLGAWALAAFYGVCLLLTLLLERAGQRRQFGRAALLLCVTAWLAVTGVGLWIDRPTADLPRGIQLLLVPLYLAQQWVLAGFLALWRRVAAGITLALFVALAALPDLAQGPPVLGHGERLVGLWTAILAAGLLTQSLSKARAAEARERQGLALELAQAIAANQLELHFQPQCDAAGQLIGLEALLRWPHPQLGLLRPAQFLALAERRDLMGPLGAWVLRHAAVQAGRWAEHPQLGHVPIALNISLAQVQEPAERARLLAQLQALLLPAGRLRFEFTEPVFAAHPQTLEALLQACRAQGVRTTLEHFGAGWSALASLAHLPLDQIKIDRQFVHKLGPADVEDPQRHSIVQAVLRLGEQLELEVLATGVETEAQLAALKALGCRLFQGHWFGEPMRATALERWAAAGGLS